jgi:tRNA (adenine37-N6)-methyltransferase
MTTYTITPIGFMHCELASREETPRNYDISGIVGVIEILPEYEDALDGVEAGQTVVALFWLHQAARDILQVYPRGDRSRGLKGVFATRSPVRPNPIAISELQVLGRDGLRLTVKGVDVLDGTPLVDLKKKI